MLVEVVLAGPGGFAAGAVFAFFAPEIVRKRAVAFRRVVATAAAAGAIFAGTQPTGLRPADVILPAALAAAVTSLAARARPWTMTFVALLTAAASLGSAGAVFGFAGAGVALATALTARKAPVATVIVGALIVNALLRLRLPGFHGLESILAGALIAPVVWSGNRRLQRSTRRKARLSALVTAGAFALLGLVGAGAVATARPGLERGALSAGRGLAAAKTADQANATADLETSEAAFTDASRTLDAIWVRPAELVPIVSQHLRALRKAASTGRELAGAGGRVAQASDLNGIRIQDGRIPLEPIQALAAPLAAARDDVTKAVRELRTVQSPWLVGPVGDRLDDNLQRLADSRESLGTSAQLVEVLPDLLGAKGERRYFLALQTPSESRATGGFLGNYGEIEINQGHMQLTKSGRIGDLDDAGSRFAKELIGPTDYISRYGRFDVAANWRSVNLSPDFPTVTKVISGLYPQSGGEALDGAIAVDPAGLAAILRLTGPLTVPAWPEPLTADNVERILLHEQYVRFGDTSDRINFLGDATDLLWKKLTTGEFPSPDAIVRTLGPAVADKHIFVSSLNPREEAALQRAGVNGELRKLGNDDSVAIVTQNAVGNKIDFFLHRTLDYQVSMDRARGVLDARLKLTLRNDSPATGLPAYVIGSATKPPLPGGTNRIYLSIYSPHQLQSATLNGIPTSMESEVELGRNVFSAFVDVGPGAETTVELDLVGAAPSAPYRVALHRQPVVHPDSVTLSVTEGNGRPLVRELTLTRDKLVAFDSGIAE